jgi:hypothetical protein
MAVRREEAPKGPGKEAPKGPAPPGCMPPKKRRFRCGTTWPEPIKGDVPYANSRPELADLCLGEKVRIVMETPAWREVLKPILDALDEERPKRGPKPSYSSEELESCLLYQRLAGVSTYAEARALLAGDHGERDRAVLGFDKHRERVGRSLHLVTSKEGVPSEATVWRHKNRFGLDRHVAAYRVLFEALVREHFKEFPDQMSEEAQLVHWDGSALLTHYTSRERKKRRKDGTKEVKPPTLVGGGFKRREMDNAGKDGDGFCMVAAVTQTGLPLVGRLTPLQANEGKTTVAILKDEWRRVVAPYLCDDKVRIMAGDGAYSGSNVRAAVHRAGFVPNTHTVSHAKRDRSLDNAEDRRAARLEIRGCEDWHLNGLFELFCKCGRGKTYRRADKKKSGVFVEDPVTGERRELPEAVARLEGSCPDCESISLTAGHWRMYNSSKGVAKVQPGEEHETDWRVGNPLTFDDLVSKRYGKARYGHGEGFHGTLVTRFGLLKEKAWYRDRRQAERDVMQVFCAMHSIAKHQRRLAAHGAPGAPLTGASGPPPPLARAA